MTPPSRIRQNQASQQIQSPKAPTNFPTPTHPRTTSSKKNRIIPQRLTTNPLHLILTASTQKIKPHTIRLRIDKSIEPRSQLCILRISQICTLKNTVLHPLAIRLQHLMYLCSSLVIWNIVRNSNKHKSLQNQRWILLRLSHQILTQQPCLDQERLLVRAFLLQHRMLKLHLLLLLIEPQKSLTAII